MSPSTSFSPSGQPTFICPPLPLLEGIYIKDDGSIIDNTAVTTTSQCTASSDTVSETSTSTFPIIGQWDPTAGLGIEIDNDSVGSDSTDALVVGSNNSKRVVVRNEIFDANAVFTSSPCLRRLGAKLESSSKATFCSSRFKDSKGSNCAFGNHGVQNKGSLNIVDSTLEGTSKAGLAVLGGKTVIVGESTHIRSLGGSVKFNPAIAMYDGTLDVHQGTFGEGQDYSLLLYPFSSSQAVANIYGGVWKSKLVVETVRGTLNVYVRDLSNPTTLCDGNSFSPASVTVDRGGTVNYFLCTSIPYEVPTFPECD